jgi:3-methylcrotonyl-CoA carboxylase alpha subunit
MPTPDDTGGLSSPMPGKIIALLAQVGESLERGAPLLVLEAVKMEHTINAPSEGKVTAFNYGIGDQVSEGDLLVVFEALEKPAPPNVAVAIGA